MNKIFTEIAAFLRVEKIINDKRIVVFLICVLIATVLWFLNALEKEYTTTITYPIKYVNLPEKQFISNDPPHNFDLQVQAYGFTLLRQKLSFSFSPIVINVKNLVLNQNNSSNTFDVNTSSLRRRIEEQISSEMTITNIRPEFITIVLDSLKTKQIKVKPNVKLDFLPQFNLAGVIEIVPQMVSVTGPANAVDTMNIIHTEFKEFTKLDERTTKTLSLIHNENITVKPSQVKMVIPVEKFTEKTLKIPVTLRNKPDSVLIKLFPSEINLSVLVGLSEFENLTAASFTAEVDFNSISTQTENLQVKISMAPVFVEILRYSPDFVEFLIETN